MDGVSILSDLQSNLCYKLNDTHAKPSSNF